MITIAKPSGVLATTAQTFRQLAHPSLPDEAWSAVEAIFAAVDRLVEVYEQENSRNGGR
jgi:hypothetical protein